MKMNLISSAFESGEPIPIKYSCKGKDVSPPLNWDNVPENTVSFVLICDDPDAPMGTWVHWVYYNIPGTLHGLPEAVPADHVPATGGVQGITSFRSFGYGGPCPPGGTHRYFFKLYALDIKLDLSKSAGKREVLKAMEEHILAKTELMGTFTK